MIKLKNILSEIGEGNSKPFKWKADTNFNSWLKQAVKNAKDIAGQTVITDVPDFTYSFTSDITNTVYEVYIKSSIGNLSKDKSTARIKYFIKCSVAFGIKSAKQDEDTNLNEQYRIMATVTQCIFDFIKRLEDSEQVKLTALYIYPKSDKNSYNSNIDSKRGRMYLMYIDKMVSKIPSSREFRVALLGSGEGYVIIPA